MFFAFEIYELIPDLQVYIISVISAVGTDMVLRIPRRRSFFFVILI